MFEAWEFRSSDIDLAASVQHGIPVVGVNERHEAIDVFSFLGPLCVKQLHECGLAVYKNKIALLCDNHFAEPVMRGLMGLGAHAELFPNAADVHADEWDAIVVALTPATIPRIGYTMHLTSVIPREAVVVQFWGDIDRRGTVSQGLNVWPPGSPQTGHMAVLLSEIGPEPIVRLQAGGLRRRMDSTRRRRIAEWFRPARKADMRQHSLMWLARAQSRRNCGLLDPNGRSPLASPTPPRSPPARRFQPIKR